MCVNQISLKSTAHRDTSPTTPALVLRVMYRRPGLFTTIIHTHSVYTYKIFKWENMTKDNLSLCRKSFFSGHASFSMFTMLYLAVSNCYTLLCTQIHAGTHMLIVTEAPVCGGSSGKLLGFDWRIHCLKEKNTTMFLSNQPPTPSSPLPLYFFAPWRVRWMHSASSYFLQGS